MCLSKITSVQMLSPLFCNRQQSIYCVLNTKDLVFVSLCGDYKNKRIWNDVFIVLCVEECLKFKTLYLTLDHVNLICVLPLL